jgi:hypothetical protein
MNDKLLLISCITLLYRQSQLPGNVENSATLVRKVLDNIKLAEVAASFDHEREILDGLKKTALSMCNDPIGHVYEPMEMLQRLRVNTGEDSSSYEALADGIRQELTEMALKRTCINLHHRVDNYFREKAVTEIMRKRAYTLTFERHKITDMKEFVAETAALLEPYQHDILVKDPAIVNEIDMNDDAGVEALVGEVTEMNDGNGLMVLGLQGLNRMFQGGLRRGEEVLLGALQHNYKTGLSLTIFKQIALYNKPYMIDETKKPLLVRISFEDGLANNFQFLYQSLWENEHGTKADMTNLSDKEVARYVQDKLRVNGYNIKMIRVDPTKWSYIDIINKLMQYEAEGYESHLCMLDYLGMVPTTGCLQGPMGTDMRDMFRRLRNYTNPRKITLFTPHQLSPEAKRLMREGGDAFVKMVANKGYWAGCTSLDNEVDLEFYCHIEKFNGDSFLTIQRGKHRNNGIIEEIDKYCVYPFQRVGGILDDINGPDMSCRKVGGGPVGSGKEVPFWSLED